MHLDVQTPNSDFPALYNYGIVSSVSSIVAYHVGIYCKNNTLTKLQPFFLLQNLHWQTLLAKTLVKSLTFLPALPAFATLHK
jgi:hypothetical protein